MFIVPSRFKSESTFDVPKRISRSGKSRAELQSVGQRLGFTDRELSAADVSKLSSDEFLWFETFFPQRIEQAAEIESNKRNNQAVKKTMDARNFWNRNWNDQPANETEATANRAVIERFKQAFPQFLMDKRENFCVIEYLKENDMDFTYPNLVEAFQACVLDGRAVVSPAKINAGSEDEVTGENLTQHRAIRLLMMPQSRPDDVSAKDFYNAHSELHDNRTPPLILARQAKAEETKRYFQQANDSTASSGVTTVVDYPQEQSGYPSHPTKYSFRRLLDSLSATEYQRRISEDPAFAAAVEQAQ